MALCFKWLPLVISFIVWYKKGLMSLFRDCLNLTSFYNGEFISLHALKLTLWYYLVHISYILGLSLSLVVRWIP